MPSGSVQYRIVVWILRLGLPLLLLLGGLVFAAHKGSARLVEPLRWYGEVRLEELSFDLGGVVRMKEVNYRPFGVPDEMALDAEGVEIKTPGLLWLVSAGIAGAQTSPAEQRRAWATKGNGGPLTPEPRALPAVERLEISVQNLSLPSAFWLPKQLSWIGLSSGAPFEALACGSQRRFGAEDFTGMGLPHDPLRVHAVIDGSKDLAHVVVKIGNDGRLHTTYDAKLRVKDPTRFFDTDWQTMEPVEELWRVNDGGFIVARNRYCAHRLRLSRNTFVDRHVEAVQAALGTLGVGAPPELMETYRRFSSRGGELSWHAKPKNPIDFGRLAGLARDQRIDALGATLMVNGETAVPFALTDPVPPPEEVTDGTTPLTLPTTPTTTTSTAPTTTTATATTPSTTTATATTTAAVVKPPVTTTTTPVATTTAPVTPPVTPPKPPPIATPATTTATAPVATTTATTPTTTATTQVAKITPPKAGLPAVGPIRFDDLKNAIGRTVMVYTSYGTIRSGTVMTYNKVAFTLKTREHGQDLTLVLPRNTVKKIELVEPESG